MHVLYVTVNCLTFILKNKRFVYFVDTLLNFIKKHEHSICFNCLFFIYNSGRTNI